ncbi:MAG: hypothetical protein ACLGIR_11080 [Actinomycetes bacterium]
MTAVRLVVSALVLVLLARGARVAWSQRRLALLVWRSVRPRHVVGSLGLLVLVGGTASVLLATVPPLRLGVGSLLGFGGNAVFAPLEQAAASSATATGTASGVDWPLLLGSTLFLGLLATLMPWFAFVEEEVFRAGLEDASPAQEVVAALRFGLVHLVMLVPVAATLAIAVAGWVYGRVYRRAHARADGGDVPEPVARAFRSTRRSAAAAQRARRAAVPTPTAAPETMLVVDRTPERRQAVAVLASTVWHATFNTVVVGLVWLSLALAALGV